MKKNRRIPIRPMLCALAAAMALAAAPSVLAANGSNGETGIPPGDMPLDSAVYYPYDLTGVYQYIFDGEDSLTDWHAGIYRYSNTVYITEGPHESGLFLSENTKPYFGVDFVEAVFSGIPTDFTSGGKEYHGSVSYWEAAQKDGGEWSVDTTFVLGTNLGSEYTSLEYYDSLPEYTSSSFEGGTVYTRTPPEISRSDYDDVQEIYNDYHKVFIFDREARVFLDSIFFMEIESRIKANCKTWQSLDAYITEAEAARQKREAQLESVQYSFTVTPLARYSGGGGNATIDTDASEEAGETEAGVSADIVEGRPAGPSGSVPPADTAGAGASPVAAAGIGAAATIAAIAAAGAVAGGKGEGGKENAQRSTYKMVVYKDFGNKIRYGPNPVFVYARMVELPPGGGERDRPDLTARISITAGSPSLLVQPPMMRGRDMAATVYAHSELHEMARPSEGIISFRFTGEGGSFQNNVRFQLVGAPRIEVQGAWLLEGANNTAALPFTLKDFLSPHKAQVEFSMQDAELPFSIEMERPDMHNGLLRIAASGDAAEMDGLFQHYHGTLCAKSPDDEAEEAFVITLCREGLYLDFGTRENRPEIRCYPDENGEMPATRVGIGLAIWDEGAKRLKMLPPPDPELRVEDAKQIGERIGLLWSPTGQTMRGRQITDESLAVWELKAKKLLPYLEQVPATLHARCVYKGREYESAFEIRLVSDPVAYYREYDRQWDHLWNLLSCAFSPQADQLRHQLSRMKSRMGLADFQDYERAFRQKLQAELEHSQAEYMATCVAYDSLIEALEWMELFGNICTEILLAVFAGPMAAFAIGNFKDLLVDVGKEYLYNKNFSAVHVPGMLWGTLAKGTWGALDNMADFPPPNEYKKLAVWVSVYFCYRVIWHWQYDTDEETGKPAGLRSAIKAAAFDLTLKAALELGLKDIIRASPKSGKAFGMDTEGVKAVADMDADAFNSARDVLFEKAGEFAERLMEFVRKIQGGLQV